MYILAYFYHSLDFSKHSHQFWIIFVSSIFDEKYPPIFLRYFRYIRKIQVPIYPYLPIFQSLAAVRFLFWYNKAMDDPLILPHFYLECICSLRSNPSFSFDLWWESYPKLPPRWNNLLPPRWNNLLLLVPRAPYNVFWKWVIYIYIYIYIYY